MKNLPFLIGSAKQVNWAESIRDELLSQVNEQLISIVASKFDFKDDIEKDRAIYKAIRDIENITDSSMWINLKNCSAYDVLMLFVKHELLLRDRVGVLQDSLDEEILVIRDFNKSESKDWSIINEQRQRLLEKYNVVRNTSSVIAVKNNTGVIVYRHDIGDCNVVQEGKGVVVDSSNKLVMIQLENMKFKNPKEFDKQMLMPVDPLFLDRAIYKDPHERLFVADAVRIDTYF